MDDVHVPYATRGAGIVLYQHHQERKQQRGRVDPIGQQETFAPTHYQNLQTSEKEDQIDPGYPHQQVNTLDASSHAP